MVSRLAPAPAIRPGLRVISGSVRVRVQLRQLGWLLLAVALFFALIYSRVHLDRAAFQLTTLETSIEQQEAEFDELRLQVAQLESPERIYAEAETMGMILPPTGRTLFAPMPVPTDEIGDLAGADAPTVLATLGEQ